MAKRKAISKKIRFEVFKRDSFTCQYCGRKAPEIILEIDHIKPHSKGGEDGIINLITSCFDCNIGKSDRELSDNSVVEKQRKQLEELQIRREQLDMMLEWKNALSDKSYEIDRCIEYFNKVHCSAISLTDAGLKTMNWRIKKFGLDKVLTAIEVCFERHPDMDVNDRFNKITGILYYLNSSPEERQVYYLKGVIRNKWPDKNSYYYTNEITNVLPRVLEHYKYEYILNLTKGAYSYSGWVGEIYKLINEAEKEN